MSLHRSEGLCCQYEHVMRVLLVSVTHSYKPSEQFVLHLADFCYTERTQFACSLMQCWTHSRSFSCLPLSEHDVLFICGNHVELRQTFLVRVLLSSEAISY